MSLRDAVLSRGIIRRSIKRAYRSLAGRAALKLSTDFFSAAMFEWIGATACDKRERANDRQGFHLFILESKCANAIADCNGGWVEALKQSSVVAVLAAASADV
jgi:hypothetical protein